MPRTTTRRERLRSRFHVAALILGCTVLLSACSSRFGAGIAELPASQGWQPLPIGSWVLNDGLEARTMVFCPRDTCSKQGFASVIAFTGSQAQRDGTGAQSRPGKPRPHLCQAAARHESQFQDGEAERPPKSTTTVNRFEAEGAAGLLVEIRAKDASGKSATTAILHGREADALVVALAVADDPAAARRDAVAAWRSR